MSQSLLPHEVTEALNLALERAEAGSVDSATAILTRLSGQPDAFEPDPDQPARIHAHYLQAVGEVSRLRHDWPQAINALRRSLEILQTLDPSTRDLAASWGRLGHVLGLSRDLEGARGAFRNSFKLYDVASLVEPQLRDRTHFGLVLVRNDCLREAADAFEKALEYVGRDVRPLSQLWRRRANAYNLLIQQKRRAGEVTSDEIAALVEASERAIGRALEYAELSGSRRDADIAGAEQAALFILRGHYQDGFRQVRNLLAAAGFAPHWTDLLRDTCRHYIAVGHPEMGIPFLRRLTTWGSERVRSSILGPAWGYLVLYDPEADPVSTVEAAGNAFRHLHRESPFRHQLETHLAQAGLSPNHQLMLHVLAGEPAPVDAWLAEGADVNLRSWRSGWTPLMWAAHQDDAEVVSLLLAADAAVDVVDETGQTALLLASQQGAADVVGALLDGGANAHHRDAEAFDALSWAALNGHDRVIRLLTRARAPLDRADAEGYTSLMRASHHGFTGVVAALLEAGADIHVTLPNGDTALHLAVEHGHVGCANLLVGAGASVKATNRMGRTPLHLCVFATSDPSDLMALLLSHDADPDAADRRGATPLIMAAEFGAKDAVVQLLRAGADPAHRDAGGRRAADCAGRRKHWDIYTSLLLARGVPPEDKRRLPRGVPAWGKFQLAELIDFAGSARGTTAQRMRSSQLDRVLERAVRDGADGELRIALQRMFDQPPADLTWEYLQATLTVSAISGPLFLWGIHQTLSTRLSADLLAGSASAAPFAPLVQIGRLDAFDFWLLWGSAKIIVLPQDSAFDGLPRLLQMERTSVMDIYDLIYLQASIGQRHKGEAWSVVEELFRWNGISLEEAEQSGQLSFLSSRFRR